VVEGGIRIAARLLAADPLQELSIAL